MPTDSALHIRALVPSDASEYRALMLEGYELAADAFTSTPAERAAEPLAWWQRRIHDPNGLGQAFGAFHGGTLVGTVAIEYSAKPKTRHKALVIGMYVSSAQRGLGAGRALLQAAIDHASDRPEVKALTLTVTHGNAGATRLYESAGFTPFGLEPMAIFTGAEFKAKLHMQLMLGTDAPAGA
jgi:RimJ/RimL family protein N-acetyltransferase